MHGGSWWRDGRCEVEWEMGIAHFVGAGVRMRYVTRPRFFVIVKVREREGRDFDWKWSWQSI